MESSRLRLWLVTVLVLWSVAGGELLKNGDFEEAFGQDNWWCNNCQLEHSTDAYTGQYSGQVTQRVAAWAGAGQYVNLELEKNYYFSAMIKFLNQVPGEMWHVINLMMEIDFEDGDKVFRWFGRSPYSRVANGWHQVGADISTKGDKAISQARLYVQVEHQDVDYLMDTASMVEIVPDPDWRQKADDRIEQIRRNNITLRVTVDAVHEPQNIQIMVNQTKHDFGFGTAVVADRIAGTDDINRKYQDFFYSNFQWATLENALKWRQMEWNKGDINFERPDNAMTELEDKGIPVRGHCIVWGVEQFVPDWVKGQSSEQVSSEIDRRFTYLLEHYKGKMAHWDVNNEQLHGAFFEENTGNADIMADMFRNASLLDPDTKLFLNEYHIVNEGAYTTAYANCAKELTAAGVPVHGMGIQSHLHDIPDIDVIATRLDVAKTAALPIWITELTVNNSNLDQRADGYEDVLRYYFSQDLVEGVILWGFWDKAHYNPNCVLVEGDDFVINAAGLRWQKLVLSDWATHESVEPDSREEQFDLLGFHGAYDLSVYNMGDLVKTQTFYLTKAQDITVDVNTAP